MTSGLTPRRRATSAMLSSPSWRGAGSVSRCWWAEPAARRRVSDAQLDGAAAPGDAELLAGAGLPAQPDRDLSGVCGGGGYGDVGQQGAQQPLAVFVAGGRGRPEGGQVGDGGGELAGAGQ